MPRYHVIIKQYQQFFVDDLSQIEYEYANSDFDILDHEVESVLDITTNTFIKVEDLPEQDES
jgi:uncharacterized protein YjiK